MALFIPTYFAPISQYKAIYNSDELVFEMEDNFQKQSYRNRCYIYNSNGKQLLSVPVKHQQKEGRKKTVPQVGFPQQSNGGESEGIWNIPIYL